MYRDGLLDPLCGLIMGETAENLVDLYDISREEQDEFALESQQNDRRPPRRGAPGRCSPSRRRVASVGNDRASPTTSIRGPTRRSRRSRS